jgi:small conductance mechanosensitive channel
MENLSIYSEQAEELILLYVPKLALAILTLVVGLLIIKPFVRFVKSTMAKRQVDPSLVPFIASIIKALLYTMLFISVAGMVGIETTSFIAVLGAAGLAIGLALQGSLANFAGGVLILLLKPFRVGDVIEAQGVIALVTEIQIFHTILKSWDNKVIILPNGPLSNGNITNFSTEETRKVEWVFGIGYDDDIDKARQVILDTVFHDERIIDRETPFINVSELGDNSVNLKVRAEVKGADYWAVFFEYTEKVKKAFDQAGITIPYPQRDVHLFQPNA